MTLRLGITLELRTIWGINSLVDILLVVYHMYKKVLCL